MVDKSIQYPDAQNLAQLGVQFQWLAQDADGTWWAYEAEPHQHDQGWYENEIGDHIRVGKTKRTSQWRQTLVKLESILICQERK